MLCENCKKNEATAYIKTNINGDVHEYHLCSECAAKMQEDGAFGSLGLSEVDFSPFGATTAFVSNLLSSPLSGFSAPFSIGSGKRCSCCGSDFRSIAKSGKAGCPKCYEEFRSQLTPTIKKLHGNAAHCGKHSHITSEQNDKSQIKQLKEQLAAAVKDEKYELAAELRDQIKALEKN